MGIVEARLRVAQIRSMMGTAGTQTATVPRAAGATSASAAGFASALGQAMAAGGSPASSGWSSPTKGTVSSEFGPRWGRQHQGVDIAAGAGAPVRAAADGVVRRASWYGGYGNAVIIDHGGGVSTLYGHNSALGVTVGERVRAGQQIAKVGSTGDSTGPHLHFEVEVSGKKIDPRPWLKARGVTL